MRSAATLLAIQQLPKLGETGAVRHAMLASELDPYLEGHGALLAGALEEADAEIERCRIEGIRVVSIFDEDYPARQRASPDQKPVLYLRGDEALLRRDRLVAMGGGERPDAVEMDAVDQIVDGLHGSGWGVVAVLGGEAGQTVLRAALAADMATIGVLSCGFEELPPTDREIAADIVAAGGALIGASRASQAQNPATMIGAARIATAQADLLILTGGGQVGDAMGLAGQALVRRRPILCVEPPAEVGGGYEGTRALTQEPAGNLPKLIRAIGRIGKDVRGELGDDPLARSIRPGDGAGLIAPLQAALEAGQADPPPPFWWPAP